MFFLLSLGGSCLLQPSPLEVPIYDFRGENIKVPLLRSLEHSLPEP